MTRRKALNRIGGAVLSGLPLMGGQASAQEPWPSRPIKLVCAFPTGGTSDVMARLIAAPLSKELGQQVIVENVGGAGGTIGTLRAVRAPADGYTLIQTGVGQNAVAHGLNPQLGYDSLKDFVHLTQVHSGPNVLVVHPDTPFKTLADFVSYVRANPGKLNYGYTHAASGHMAMELFKLRAGDCSGAGQAPAKGAKPTQSVRSCNGFFLVGIPYRGGGPMLQDLLGGQFPVTFINQDVALPHVRAGKLRALAVSSLKRNPLYPDVPTIHESGFPDFQALSWSGLSVARGTPQAIVDRYDAALRKILASTEFRQKLETLGFEVPPAGAQHYTAFVKSELALWTDVIRTRGIQAE